MPLHNLKQLPTGDDMGRPFGALHWRTNIQEPGSLRGCVDTKLVTVGCTGSMRWVPRAGNRLG